MKPSRFLARGPVLLLAFTGACAHCSHDEPAPPSPSASSSAPETPPPSPKAIDATTLDGCTLGHRGILLDLGDPASRARYGLHAANRPTLESLEREGGTWTRFREKGISLQFVAMERDFGDPAPPSSGQNSEPSADNDSFVEARVRGGVAKSISVYLNGKPVGNWRIAKGATRIVSAKASSDLVFNGTNELLLRFNGVPRAQVGEAYAEIDWIHIGRGEPSPNYAAPTRSDVTTNATLGGVARRALSLQAPGFVRCTGWIPKGGTAQAFAGIAGSGNAELRLSVFGDRGEKVGESTLLARAGTWEKGELPLGDVGGAAPGTVGAFEVEVVRASPGARVLVGDPALLAASSPPPPSMPHGRGVILVVLGNLQPKSLALYGGALPLPELGALAARGAIFESHRATSTLSNAALAAMISGRPGRAIALNDFDAKLPHDVTTVADVARQAGAVSAMFTGNPLTSAAFGFDRGWGTFVYHGPEEDVLATRVFDDASDWIEAHKADRFLVVIHARGGHPPWDITAEELKNLEPQGYAGGIDPKHAAELLSKARHVPPAIRFGDTDRVRVWALYSHAVTAQDAALGKLMTNLRKAGRDGDTAVFITGDVGVDETAHVPFGEGGADGAHGAR